MEKQIELWPSIGDYFVYDDLIYQVLTGDEARNEFYRRALRDLVEDKVVVDLGTGPRRGAGAALRRVGVCPGHLGGVCSRGA